jgi:hypothetical protein
MTKRASFAKSKLVSAAQVAMQQGVTITIEAPDGTVYRIAPESATMPIGRAEREAAACDRAFGIGQ